MKGIIIYTKQSLKKNLFFADKLRLELNKLGEDVSIVCIEDGIRLDGVDFAVMRAFDPDTSTMLDAEGIITFNSSVVSSIANDKYKTYILMKKFGIPVAETQLAENCDLPFPRIVKARHGHGGSEVFWADNEEQYSLIVKNMTDCAIVQPPTGERGRDLRVYVIDGKPIVAFLRKSEADFRSNFSLGGAAERYVLSKAHRKLVKKVCSTLYFDFAGIDFLLGENGLILNEIEDVVGCRMVYTYCDIDIIKKYARHIYCSLHHCQNA